MKKKPIYLYVLVILSGVLTAIGLPSLFAGQAQKVTDEFADLLQLTGDSIPQYQEYINQSFALSKSPISIGFTLLEIGILIAAIYFLFFKKDILYANLSYIAYLLLSLLSMIYSRFVMSGYHSLLVDDAVRNRQIQSENIFFIVTLVINALFLALVLYKLWRQQQELEKEEKSI